MAERDSYGVSDPMIQKLETARHKARTPLPSKDSNEIALKKLLRAVLLEYMATTLFVFYACASVIAANVYITQTVAANLFAAIVQGFAIATFVYAISHTSGGHINPAVSFALMVSGNIGFLRGVFYINVQILGGITGAALLSAFLPGRLEGQLGTTTLNDVSRFQGFLIEFLITFSLIFTIFGTALNKEAAASGLPSLAPLPIGFSITIGVGIAYSFTGGSMNPARTFGPAVISNTWDSHYIYWAGPMAAALLIGLLERYLCLFSAGQRRVIKNKRLRRRAEIRQTPVEAVPVVLEPGSDPVPMVTIVNPDDPTQAVMVPVIAPNSPHITPVKYSEEGEIMEKSNTERRRSSVVQRRGSSVVTSVPVNNFDGGITAPLSPKTAVPLSRGSPSVRASPRRRKMSLMMPPPPHHDED